MIGIYIAQDKHRTSTGQAQDKFGEEVQSATGILSKCRNCTLEETAVLQIIQRNTRATQKQIAAEIGKSERTVKTITVNLTQKGLLVRRNGKKIRVVSASEWLINQ